MTDKITTKELFQAYKTIRKVMEEYDLSLDTSFMRVKTWLANSLCDSLKDGDIIGE